MNRFFYYKGKDAIIDILNFKIITSKKLDNNLTELLKIYKEKKMPIMPIKAETLMQKYEISEGKILGDKLKMIEEEWVKNNFHISNYQVENLLKN